MDTSTLLTEICDVAHDAGIDQKVLASRAAVAEHSLSRAKRTNSAHLNTVEALANAAGLELVLVGKGTRRNHTSAKQVHTFRDKYHALIWANPDASDSVLLRRALVQPRFQMLLDAAIEFGLPRVLSEWQAINVDVTPDVQRVQPMVSRILQHIQDGYEQAQA